MEERKPQETAVGGLANRIKEEKVISSPVYVSEKEVLSYYPTRREYLAGKAMQGLCTGRSEKDLRTVVRKSLALADEMERVLDDSEAS